ncbi:uncharacterized protein [Nicotiana sylvestris]|uniref:uncharacterized protein n=1 Tax=Nicotiana sylvestris TaxID=4096 RepID=UPI00388CCED2
MGPWFLMGDFNSILGVDDKMHGSEVQDNETRVFKEVIEDCSLAELPRVEKTYTWTNGHMYRKIDRAIVNDSWMINVPPRQVQILNPLFSDHSPLGIKVEQLAMKNRGMEVVWKNLKSIRAALKQLNNMEFKNVKGKITTIRKELDDIQGRMKIANPTSDLFEEEKELLLQLENWDKIEESIYKQNQEFNNGKSIEAELVEFYKNLLGTASGSIPAIHLGWIRNGPVITRRQHLHLITPFTKEDVMDALKGIDDVKAPGVGVMGLMHFFKKA